MRGRRLTCEEFIARHKEKHGDKFDYSQVPHTYHKYQEGLVTLICKEHGPHQGRPVDLLANKGSCKECSERIRKLEFDIGFLDGIHKKASRTSGRAMPYTDEKWRARFAKSHPGYTFSSFERVMMTNYARPVSRVFVTGTCDKQHPFRINVASLTEGRVCQRCAWDLRNADRTVRNEDIAKIELEAILHVNHPHIVVTGIRRKKRRLGSSYVLEAACPYHPQIKSLTEEEVRYGNGCQWCSKQRTKELQRQGYTLREAQDIRQNEIKQRQEQNAKVVREALESLDVES